MLIIFPRSLSFCFRLPRPSVILLSGNEIFQQEQARWLLASFILALLFHCLFLAAALLLFRRDPVLENGVLLPNSGFMGIPLVQAVLGPSAVFLFNTVYDRQHINAMDGRCLFDGSFFSLLLEKISEDTYGHRCRAGDAALFHAVIPAAGHRRHPHDDRCSEYTAGDVNPGSLTS